MEGATWQQHFQHSNIQYHKKEIKQNGDRNKSDNQNPRKKENILLWVKNVRAVNSNQIKAICYNNLPSGPHRAAPRMCRECAVNAGKQIKLRRKKTANKYTSCTVVCPFVPMTARTAALRFSVCECKSMYTYASVCLCMFMWYVIPVCWVHVNSGIDCCCWDC